MIFAAPPGSAVFHAFEQGWTTSDYLLASAVDVLSVQAWLQTRDAQEKFPRHRPKPLPRPTWGEPEPMEGKTVPLGMGSATVVTVGELMARREARQKAWLEKHGRKGG